MIVTINIIELICIFIVVNIYKLKSEAKPIVNEL